jgi:hypothetical protein
MDCLQSLSSMAPRISYDLSTKPESEATFEWFLQHIQASRGFPCTVAETVRVRENVECQGTKV